MSGSPDLTRYVEVLRADQIELDHLARDLLIGVTAFFRNAEAFAVLDEQVIPTICERLDERSPVGVWVAGCSNGEEAYSVAMAFSQWFAARDLEPRVQVFATDIDEAALDWARVGCYPADALAPVPAELRERHFVREGESYRVRKSLRERIVFAEHNLIGDPPFSRLDLLVRRNLLIHLNSETQKRLLSLFHFVLNPGGFLFLGSAESLGKVHRHFAVVSKTWRLYRRLGPARRRPPLLPFRTGLLASRLVASGFPTGVGGRAALNRGYRQLLEQQTGA